MLKPSSRTIHTSRLLTILIHLCALHVTLGVEDAAEFSPVSLENNSLSKVEAPIESKFFAKPELDGSSGQSVTFNGTRVTDEKQGLLENNSLSKMEPSIDGKDFVTKELKGSSKKLENANDTRIADPEQGLLKNNSLSKVEPSIDDKVFATKELKGCRNKSENANDTRIADAKQGLLKNNSLSKVEPSIDDKVFATKELGSSFKQSGSVNGTQTTAVRQGPCHCSNGVCGCCSRFLLETWRQKACVNVTYDPDEFSFTAKVWMNDRVLYTRTVSGKNPRPVCIPVPRIPVVRACVRFYNIYFQGRNVHACIAMEGKFQDTILFKVGLDCIRLGANGVALVKPEDGGGIGQVEFLPDDISASSTDDSDDDYDDEDEDVADDEDDDDDDYF